MEKQKWGWWSVFWKAFRDASPVIFFFLFLFSVVYILFGMQYGMIVSVVTIFFQTCYKNVYWFCILFMMISLHTFFHLFFPRSVQKGTLSDLLYEMSNLMFLLVRPEKKTELEHRFQNLLHRFHQVSFQKNFFSVKTKNKQIHDMVNTLLQRFSYLLTDDEWREELDPEHVLLFGRMATFLREIASETDRESRRHQIKTAQMHLDQMIVPEGRVRIFCRSMLHILILILKTEGEETPDIRKIHRVSWRGLFQQIRTRFSPESFETRSALRLSALMMISLMYCAVPGTWYHPIFSTCYALTLAGMTMQETVAITLRLLFLAAAIGIVFLVNRFFFPIRKEALFRYNVRGLLRLNRSYWQVIRKELD